MPNTSSLTKAQRTYRERATGTYIATLNDENGDPIALADIGTITLTLKEVTSGTVINSRDDQDVKNANNVTIHATSGLLTWDIQIADNAIVGTLTNGQVEIHRALFEYTWNSATDASHHEVLLFVVALDDVP